MNRRWTVVAVCFLLEIVNCEVLNCCQGNNTITAKKCDEGLLNDVLPCSNKFLIKKRTVDVDELAGILRYEDVTVEKDRFCRSNVNGSTMFIVCYEPHEMESEPWHIFVVLEFISAFFLFLTAAIYIALPKLLDLQGICIVHSIVGLACSFVLLATNTLLATNPTLTCQIYAYSLYFSFLYAFFWLNTYCFQMWRTTIQPEFISNVKSWRTIYYIYSCGGPLILLSIVFLSQYSNLYIYIHPRMAEEAICWFGTVEASFAYLYVPISILLSLNMIFFFWTIHGLWKEVHKYDGKKMKIYKYRLSLCIKMFFVMGISWIFEVLSVVFGHKYPSTLWKITDAVNSLQGVLIFLVMVVFRKKVYRLMAEKPYGRMLPTTWETIAGGDEECTESEEDCNFDRVNYKNDAATF